MAIQFAESGGQYHFSKGANPPGLWGSTSGANLSSVAPSYNGSTFAYGGFNATLKTVSLGSFAAMIAGYRLYTPSLIASQLIIFYDASGVNQCDLRINASGIFNFTRNGTVIGASSTVPLVAGVWNYIEFKAIFSTSGTGTCEAVLNGVTILTSTSLTNATTTTVGSFTGYQTPNVIGPFCADFYTLDTGSGVNTTYLGDVTVGEIYPNGAGVNSQWAEGTNNAGTASPPPFAISSVAGTVFTRTITATGEAANAYQGYYFTTSGFTGSNGTFLCTASSTTTITLQGSVLTGSGSIDFQAIVQPGIHGGLVDSFSTTNVGTRPNDDAAYIASSTATQISDFGHQALVLTGTIFGVVHVTYAKKDDAGTRVISQTCISTGNTELTANISLPGTYQYFLDVLEKDPHTNASFGVAGFNSATFGVKLIS